MDLLSAICRWRLVLGLLCLGLFATDHVAAGDDREWQPIANDGLRDPKSPAVRILQQPRDALSGLAPDNAGNQVRWVQALKEGQINPRSFLRTDRKWETYDKDVLLNLNGGMPVVRFPHSAHTPWLDCTNCHDHLFKKKRGATEISMFLILQGEQCGVCHGAVAFPLTECSRCHSVKRSDAMAELEREAAAAKPAGAAEPTSPPSAPTTPPTSGPAQRDKKK
ncbi:MAG TPA: c(7)-type cytochrome triheme domain-containing protein [Aromatoleum sp.]|uniref:c(7)-type cytochrome triheme domain-containing protein n=1 Tax=Aromatoleum sp. TaxID=2307007 RepID=UPI002B47F2C1|nr:c(7)-type cytochrome triheme domain-containing protein [Aromatoleum sp.]HJV25457.1 c(7)-type cytochrome triheme domain-containing protein [Aromatoleum sp.]